MYVCIYVYVNIHTYTHMPKEITLAFSSVHVEDTFHVLAMDGSRCDTSTERSCLHGVTLPSTCWPLCRTPQPCCWLCSAGCASFPSRWAPPKRSPWRSCPACGLQVRVSVRVSVRRRRVRKRESDWKQRWKDEKTETESFVRQGEKTTEKRTAKILICLVWWISRG